MNLFKTKFRRTTAVVAGAILGLGGVAVLAAPASAHAPTVTGGTPCLSGDSWPVIWSIGNDYQDDATVGEVSATVRKDGSDERTPQAIGGPITDTGVIIPAHSDGDASKQVRASTTITDPAVRSVTLKVILVWPDGYTNDGKYGHRGPEYKTVDRPEKCTPPTPTAPTTTADSPPAPTPSETTPGLPIPTPSTTDEPNVFTPILEETCDTITIGADNPADGLTWTLSFKTSKGEERQFTLKPGEKKTETFSATPGFWVKVTVAVTVDGKTYSDFERIDYDKPEDCTGSGGGLPVTGAAAGGIASGAAVLLALGVMLFVLARRRKVRFTA